MDLSSFYGGRDFSWMDAAACAKGFDEDGEFIVDPELFFPPRDKALYKPIADEAKRYCLGTAGRPACPVRKECLWYAIDLDMEHGILGGLSHRERNALVRKWKRSYKDKMTLKEYIFQLEKRRASNGNKTKERPVETPGHEEQG